MKKRNLKSLKLSKKSISKFTFRELKGGGNGSRPHGNWGTNCLCK